MVSALRNMRSLVGISDPMLDLRCSQRHAGGDEALSSHVGRGLMPQLKQSISKGQRLAQLPGALLAKRAAFNCPICSYTGPFLDTGPTCWMFNDQCLWCGALSRHRIQYCALEEFFLTYDCRGKAAIHFAPEPQFSRDIRPSFAIYHTADLNPQQVDFRADLRDLPFGDRSYDFLYASHVLEHIDDDQRALSEIRRVLRPGGVAILPVPIIGAKTVEYPYPSPVEAFHVRAPGVDYFDRYAAAFNRVELKSSQDYPASFQLYIYETRASYFGQSSKDTNISTMSRSVNFKLRRGL
jgi:SAM-dependent methyltransferase